MFNKMGREMERAVDIIKKSRNIIALTGAGISVESGIPDFRSAGGLWEKYDPSFYANISSFYSAPERVWEMIFEMVDLILDAKPNPAHLALSELEKMGNLNAVITQNIDNLHQEAGNTNVIEYHGNALKLECLNCDVKYNGNEFDRSVRVPPVCGKCGSILKPAVVFFGEIIPHEAMIFSNQYASEADAVLVIGTSAVVYPAAAIPVTAKRNGAKVIEFNIERTELTDHVADVFIKGTAGKTLSELISLLKKDK